MIMKGFKTVRRNRADRTGLGPATSAVTGRHSNQLNYRSVPNYFRDGKDKRLEFPAKKVLALHKKMSTGAYFRLPYRPIFQYATFIGEEPAYLAQTTIFS